MYIAPHNNFSFIHLNKTGGISAVRYMETHLKNFYCLGTWSIHRPLKSVVLHAMGAALVAMIRNPYDRYESLYAYRKMKYQQGTVPLHSMHDQWLISDGNFLAQNMGFEAWMTGILKSDSYTELPLSELLEPWPNNLRLIRLEDIQTDLPAFLGVDCSLFPVPHINASFLTITAKNSFNRTYIEWPVELQREVWDREERIFTNYYPKEERP